MTNPVAVNAYGVAVGTAPNASMVPFVASYSPSSTNIVGPNGPWKIGQLWVNSSTDDTFILSSYTSVAGAVTANWSQSTSGTGAVNTLTGNTGGPVVPTLGNINIVGAGGTLVDGSGSTLTITAAPQTFTWNVDAANGAAAVNNGYIIQTGSKSYSLPASSAVGDEIALMLNGGTSWTVTQAASQYIQVGGSTSTVGVGGSIASTMDGDTIWLICVEANLGWMALSYVGSISVA